MRKNKFMKIILSTTLTIAMMFSVFISSYAVSSDINSLTKSEEILVSFGYPKDMLNLLSENEKNEMAIEMTNEPASVKIDVTTVHFDELYWIEFIANASDEELFKKGLSLEEININRNNIRDLRELSYSELKEIYDRSDEEIKLLKIAATPKENYQEPKEITNKNKVTISQISTTTMTYATTVTNNSSITKKPVSYAVKITFNWKTHPAITFLKDKIAATWGCNLNSMSENGTITFTGNGGSTRSPEIEVEPNRGLVFSFWQRAVNGLGWDLLKSGTINFTVFQNSKQNLSAALVTQYGHGILTITGGGVSFGSGADVGIDFAVGFDTSAPKRYNLSV